MPSSTLSNPQIDQRALSLVADAFAHAPLGALFVDNDDCVVYLNARASALLDRSIDEVMGARIADVMPGLTAALSEQRRSATADNTLALRVKARVKARAQAQQPIDLLVRLA